MEDEDVVPGTRRSERRGEQRGCRGRRLSVAGVLQLGPSGSRDQARSLEACSFRVGAGPGLCPTGCNSYWEVSGLEPPLGLEERGRRTGTGLRQGVQRT